MTIGHAGIMRKSVVEKVQKDVRRNQDEIMSIRECERCKAKVKRYYGNKGKPNAMT